MKSYYKLNELSLFQVESKFDKVFANYPYYQKLKETYQFVKKAHGKQTRSHALIPYFIHLLRICIVLYEYMKINDIDMLLAALLHDVVEDTKVTQVEIEQRYNKRIARLVKALTRIKPANETPEQKFFNKRKKLQKTIKSEQEVKILKAVDLADNMNDWLFIPKGHKTLKKLPRWMAEAKLGYMPLAETLGPQYLKPMQYVYDKLLQQGYKPGKSNFEL